MGTVGNLELRTAREILYDSSTHDGYAVYKIIGRFADFLESRSDPTIAEYKEWFQRAARSF